MSPPNGSTKVTKNRGKSQDLAGRDSPNGRARSTTSFWLQPRGRESERESLPRWNRNKRMNYWGIDAGWTAEKWMDLFCAIFLRSEVMFLLPDLSWLGGVNHFFFHQIPFEFGGYVIQCNDPQVIDTCSSICPLWWLVPIWGKPAHLSIIKRWGPPRSFDGIWRTLRRMGAFKVFNKNHQTDRDILNNAWWMIGSA